ncbi:MAG TPA: DUF1294 domain-containing protein [Tepidisphaeraceae bacterium]|jgi:uncharacterized membrane protein YsdA (DUF1294 family)|nr:DUF1294 domain-containing protein [Tepidisphaeraceae bacterium]
MLWILAYYLLASLITFVVYGIDKRRAARRQWRVPEATLQSLAFAGGFPGAFVGRKTFRHKLHKPKFTFMLYAIAMLHGLAWAVYLAM